MAAMAAKAEVLDYVKKFENQTKYSVWVMEDKNVKLKYAGVDGEVGVNQAWDSEVKNVGAGNQTLTALTDSRVDVDIHFDKPMKGDVKAATILETITDNETKITTEFYSTTPRPFSVMSYLIGKPIISKAMKQNLINIKSNLEK